MLATSYNDFVDMSHRATLRRLVQCGLVQSRRETRHFWLDRHHYVTVLGTFDVSVMHTWFSLRHLSCLQALEQLARERLNQYLRSCSIRPATTFVVIFSQRSMMMCGSKLHVTPDVYRLHHGYPDEDLAVADPLQVRTSH